MCADERRKLQQAIREEVRYQDADISQDDLDILVSVHVGATTSTSWPTSPTTNSYRPSPSLPPLVVSKAATRRRGSWSCGRTYSTRGGCT
jgi:hypothetical protein